MNIKQLMKDLESCKDDIKALPYTIFSLAVLWIILDLFT